jgi:hypothetical protein
MIIFRLILCLLLIINKEQTKRWPIFSLFSVLAVAYSMAAPICAALEKLLMPDVFALKFAHAATSGPVNLSKVALYVAPDLLFLGPWFCLYFLSTYALKEQAKFNAMYLARVNESIFGVKASMFLVTFVTACVGASMTRENTYSGAVFSFCAIAISSLCAMAWLRWA